MKPFHEMTREEMTKHLHSLYHAQPKADWDVLLVGNLILHNGRGWRITRIPPKRGFIIGTNLITGESEKLLRSQYATPDLLVIDEATLALLETSHLEEIKTAMAVGISISRLVQYDYPEIFTPYPTSWDEKRREKANDIWSRFNEMRAFHDSQDTPGWQLRKVAQMKDDASTEIVRWETYRAEVEAGVKIKKPEAIPRIVASVNQTISDFKEELEILDHLRKHLENAVPNVGSHGGTN
jgi:hypothetical protein